MRCLETLPGQFRLEWNSFCFTPHELCRLCSQLGFGAKCKHKVKCSTAVLDLNEMQNVKVFAIYPARAHLASGFSCLLVACLASVQAMVHVVAHNPDRALSRTRHSSIYVRLLDMLTCDHQAANPRPFAAFCWLLLSVTASLQKTAIVLCKLSLHKCLCHSQILSMAYKQASLCSMIQKHQT